MEDYRRKVIDFLRSMYEDKETKRFRSSATKLAESKNTIAIKSHYEEAKYSEQRKKILRDVVARKLTDLSQSKPIDFLSFWREISQEQGFTPLLNKPILKKFGHSAKIATFSDKKIYDVISSMLELLMITPDTSRLIPFLITKEQTAKFIDEFENHVSRKGILFGIKYLAETDEDLRNRLIAKHNSLREKGQAADLLRLSDFINTNPDLKRTISLRADFDLVRIGDNTNGAVLLLEHSTTPGRNASLQTPTNIFQNMVALRTAWEKSKLDPALFECVRKTLQEIVKNPETLATASARSAFDALEKKH